MYFGPIAFSQNTLRSNGTGALKALAVLLLMLIIHQEKEGVFKHYSQDVVCMHEEEAFQC